MNLLIVATIAGGLLVDYHWIAYGQFAANVATWAVCLGLWATVDPARRPRLLACIVIATAGECFLSLFWGLYEYRLQNIPLFVPPGHVLLFFLGMQLAPRLSERMAWGIAIAAFPVVLAFAWTGRDTLGLVLYGFFILCMFLPGRKLYATMFVISFAMEIYGTWIGNWVWAPNVPWLPLTTLNPPVAAGAFYCVLDFLVLLATRRRDQPPASPGLNPSMASTQAATLSACSSSR
jgi:hypothetical protein